MVRHRRTSAKRSSASRAHLTRIYAHTPPTSRSPRHQRRRERVHLQKNNNRRRDQKDNLEDTYRSLLFGKSDAGDDETGSSDGTDMDRSSVDSEWDEETTLVEILGSPYSTRFHLLCYFLADLAASREYNEGEVLNALRQAFADSSHDLREDTIVALLPALNSGRIARPAPGRDFITGLLGFDDVCKRFEKKNYRSAEFDAAYAKIEEKIRDLFEQLQVAYTQLEERRAVFQQEVKEDTNKMLEIISKIPAQADALVANLQRTYIDTSKDHGGIVKGKGRERTIQGALAELQL